MNESAQGTGERLNQFVAEAGMAALDAAAVQQFESFVSLFIRWSARINLTSVRDEEGILRRHLLESIACARALPAGIATLLDFGSGGGFPGIPIAICRPEISVTLAESQGKKAAFLQEAVRILGKAVHVHAGRAETFQAPVDCVVLRAVDRMEEAVRTAAGMLLPGGWLALMTTHSDLLRLHAAAGPRFVWTDPLSLRGSESRILSLGAKLNSAA
ncbi:MAG: 16S rRNA (guanine(527)-N(7))-methyltransferase RsmG [Acidobacteriota bacterium]